MQYTWRQMVSLTLWPLYLQGSNSQYPLLWGWISLKSDLDALKKWKVSCPCQKCNFISSVFQPTCYTNWAIPLPMFQSVSYDTVRWKYGLHSLFQSSRNESSGVCLTALEVRQNLCHKMNHLICYHFINSIT
jgi:hypothetical protein